MSNWRDGGVIHGGDGAVEYQLLSRLGRGGDGECWAALQPDVQTRVVLKRAAVSDDRAAFYGEATAVKSLDHPEIAKFSRGFIYDGDFVLVRDYIEGVPIDAALAEARLGIFGRIRAFSRILDAMAYAHEREVIHGDIKPANIIGRRGPGRDVRPCIIDFSPTRFRYRLSSSFAIGESPGYEVPEQITMATRTSDVFGLGLLLIELLAGEAARMAVGRKRASEDLAVLVKKAVDIDRKRRRADGEEAPHLPSETDVATLARLLDETYFQELLALMLSLDPAARMPSAGELQEKFRDVFRRDRFERRLLAGIGSYRKQVDEAKGWIAATWLGAGPDFIAVAAEDNRLAVHRRRQDGEQVGWAAMDLPLGDECSFRTIAVDRPQDALKDGRILIALAEGGSDPNDIVSVQTLVLEGGEWRWDGPGTLIGGLFASTPRWSTLDEWSQVTLRSLSLRDGLLTFARGASVWVVPADVAAVDALDVVDRGSMKKFIVDMEARVVAVRSVPGHWIDERRWRDMVSDPHVQDRAFGLHLAALDICQHSRVLLIATEQQVFLISFRWEADEFRQTGRVPLFTATEGVWIGGLEEAQTFDGWRVAIATTRGVEIIDQTGERIHFIEKAMAYCLSWSWDRRLLAIGGDGSELVVVAFGDGEIHEWRVSVRSRHVVGVEFSITNPLLLLVSSSDREVEVVEVPSAPYRDGSGLMPGIYPLEAEVCTLKWTAIDGLQSTSAIVGVERTIVDMSRIQVWDVDHGEVSARPSLVGAGALDLAATTQTILTVSADGRITAVALADSTLDCSFELYPSSEYREQQPVVLVDEVTGSVWQQPVDFLPKMVACGDGTVALVWGGREWWHLPKAPGLLFWPHADLPEPTKRTHALSAVRCPTCSGPAVARLIDAGLELRCSQTCSVTRAPLDVAVERRPTWMVSDSEGRRIAVLGLRSVALVSVDDGLRVFAEHSFDVDVVSAAMVGGVEYSTLVVATTAGLEFFNPSLGSTLRVAMPGIKAVAASPCGRHLAVAHADRLRILPQGLGEWR